MSIDLPLTVRLKTRRKDVDVTTQVTDLRYRISIPGGYASLEIGLNRPLDIQPDDVEYFATVYVYDGRNGRTLWEGRLEDPGRGAGDSGEVWSITATGPRAHTQDRVFPVIYVDQSLERWHRSRYSKSNAFTEMGEIPDGGTNEETSALIIQATLGDTNITTAWLGDWIYRSIAYTGQLVARIRADVIGDGTSSNYHTAIFGRTGNAVATYSQLQNWATTNQVLAANLGSVGWDNTINVVSFRSQRDNSNTTADAFTAVYFSNVCVRAVVKNTDGSDNLSTSGYNVNNIDPNEVVEDLLGRVLTQFDGTNATVVGSGVDIDQMAYPDGTTADQILTDLAIWDPQYYWAAWESNPANGKNRFEYIPWPTTIRYEAGIEDGFDSPASASDLYNAVRIRWRDASGRIRNTRRTSTVQALTDAGLTRESYIDLSDELGSTANATYVGDNFLVEHQYPPNAGTLRVARPIIDNLTGRMVQPWEILPGHLIRVRGVLPRVDALNPTNRDGVTIFRVISVEFSVSDAIAVLELDSYTRSLTRAIADIGKSITPTTDFAKRFRKR